MLIWFVILFFLPLLLGLLFIIPFISSVGVVILIGLVGVLKKAAHWK